MNEKIKVGIKLETAEGVKKPIKATIGASGYDICSKIRTIIPAGQFATIPTGIHIEMPTGLEAQIRPRSGLAARNGITVLNSPGTIDSDYRGEICIILINHGKKDFEVKPGMRIAQMVFAKILDIELIAKDELDRSLRGTGGFGSTGI